MLSSLSFLLPGRLSAQINGRVTILQKIFLTKMTPSFLELQWITSQPFLHGPTKWGNYGFQSFLTSGPMAG